MKTTASEVVEFWLADSGSGPRAADVQRERWYRGGAETDAEIAARFTPALHLALAGDLDGWSATATGSLALVLLLDQFTRTVFRHTARAFCGDPRAHAVAGAAIAAGQDRELTVPGRIFLYHPHHHAESLAEQDRALDLLHGMFRDAPRHWHDYIARSVQGFGRHRDIIVRFGRYPHRNQVLGRRSTAQELDYLEAGADRFGQ